MKKNEEVAYQRERIEKELGEQGGKIERADRTKSSNYNSLVQNLQDFEQTPMCKDVEFESEQLKSKYLLNAIGILVKDMPDLQSVLEQPFQEVGLDIPQVSERPGTSSSQGSRNSNRSGGSRASRRSGV